MKAVRRDDPYLTLGAARVESDKFWRWGDDNLFPTALALMSRRSTTHRRIINDRPTTSPAKASRSIRKSPCWRLRRASQWIGESLRQVCSKLSFDKSLFGNAFLEVVTDEKHSFLALYHQDASRCRVAKDSRHILLHHDWSRFSAADARTLPHLPAFRTAGRRHAPRDRPLQGLRTDVRALRRTALHRRVRRVGHRLQDRPLEYLAARQLVPNSRA